MIWVAYAVIYGLIFLAGTCIGSFLNVLIYRMPLGINIAKGRSFCPKCKNKLQAKDMVPLLSFFVLRGSCRFCGQKISGRYPAVELMGGIFALASLYFFWLTWQALLVYAAVCILLVIAFIDIDTREIPDRLNITLSVLALISVFLFPHITVIERIIGFFEISLPMLLLNLMIKDSFGGGDIKLCAACGFLLGYKAMLVGAFLGILTGGMYAIWLLLSGAKSRKDHFAFGPFLSFGLMVALYAGTMIWESYLEIFMF